MKGGMLPVNSFHSILGQISAISQSLKEWVLNIKPPAKGRQPVLWGSMSRILISLLMDAHTKTHRMLTIFSEPIVKILRYSCLISMKYQKRQQALLLHTVILGYPFYLYG